MAPPRLTLGDLPYDVLLCITDHLDFSSIVALAGTSTRFQSLLEKRRRVKTPADRALFLSQAQLWRMQVTLHVFNAIPSVACTANATWVV
jgi:hypothetical protein